MATYEKNKLYMVPLAEIQADPSQPRKYFDSVALEELTAAIKQMGIIGPVVCRQDLNPVEEAEALQKLMDDHAYQQEQLSAIIGKSQPTISESLSINRLPKEVRDECRQDPTVPKNVLVVIARKKQERSMLTQFRKYQDQQAKAAAKESETTVPAERKRTRAESLVNNIGVWASKIGDLEFPDFSKAERTSIIDAMNSLKETLDEAIPRAVKNQKKPM